MNNPEVTMQSLKTRSSFIVLDRAVEAAGIALALTERIPPSMRSLTDQLIRCSTSVPANLSEGHGHSGRSRLHHWRIAYASAKEADVFLELLIRSGAVDAVLAQRARELFDQVRAIIWRLLHPRR